MRNIDITEWLLDNQIDSETEIVVDGKQVFLADVLEKHLIEQFAISDFVGQSEQLKMFQNMQYYMEHCQREGYITPQDWLEKEKHF